MKDAVVKYESLKNGFDLLKQIDNGGVIGFDEESVNSMGGIN